MTLHHHFTFTSWWNIDANKVSGAAAEAGGPPPLSCAAPCTGKHCNLWPQGLLELETTVWVELQTLSVCQLLTLLLVLVILLNSSSVLYVLRFPDQKSTEIRQQRQWQSRVCFWVHSEEMPFALAVVVASELSGEKLTLSIIQFEGFLSHSAQA